MSNLKTLTEIYEAFGRGDVAAIMAQMSDNVDWEYGEPTTSVPWLVNRRGKEGAQAGIVATATSMEVHSFVPKAFIEGDQVIVVLYDTEFTVRSTGKRVKEEDAVHIWRFDADGKVARFRHRVDTHQQQIAVTPG